MNKLEYFLDNETHKILLDFDIQRNHLIQPEEKTKPKNMFYSEHWRPGGV